MEDFEIDEIELEYDVNNIEENTQTLANERIELEGLDLEVEFEFLRDLAEKHSTTLDCGLPLYTKLNGVYYEVGVIDLTLDFVLTIKGIDRTNKYSLTLVVDESKVDLMDYENPEVLGALVKL